MHEKEREFIDAFRLVIRNGYELQESDVLDVLRFINMHEVLVFEQDE